ncbi:MAG: carbohydrate-binding protein [Oscillospiraceae bacterium]|nr:carbohydrate-binding protein [Oscillospiraceae bacterium]
MKKPFSRMIRIFLCFILILGALPVFGRALGEEKPQTRGSYPIPAFGAQALWDKHERGIPLVVAHKGDWRNFPENSLLGINSCINMGVDIVEVDFHVTKDGVPVLLHDTNLRRVTDADTLVYIADITWAQAKKYSLEDGQGNKGTNYILSSADAKVLNSIPTYVSTVGTAKAGGTMPIARFDSVLELVNKRAFLLMDKITDADTFAYAYVCAREWDMTDYVIFKNNYTVDVMETWYAAGAKLWNQKHGNQAITAQEVKESTLYEFNSTSLTNMQAHIDSGVNLAFCSTGITADNVTRIRDTVVPFCKKNGIVIRANTGEGLGDTAKTDSEIGWAEILKVGVTEIMTDHPGELLSYLQQVYSTRAASDRIEAEHFTDYNLTNFGFQVPLEYNSGKNKFVTNLTSKDTLIYENIEFDGTENILTAKAMGSNAKITVYIDGTAAEDKLGTLSYNSTSYASAQVKIAPVPAGKHTVYLKFSGTVGLDQFRFTRGLYFAFSNETLARFRYQDRLYGSTNYDTGNWLARTATMGAASLDNTAGTLSATLTAGGNHYIQTGTAATARPLHYIPGKNDYFQLRLKITDATANDPASKIYAGLVFSGTGCGDFDYNEKVVTELTASQLNGKYVTLTMPLNSAFTAATEITALRMYFMNLASVSGKTGKITVDHLYIGPKEHLPQQDYLYFGFTDRDTDEMRYQTEAYGYQNFDSRSWIARTATMRGAWFDRQNSTLLARVTTGGNHYMQSGTSVSERPLRYAPKGNDYLQMVLQIRDGKLHDPSLPLSVGISYCGKNATEFVYDEALLNDFPASVIDSGFFTVTLPLPSSFTAESEIQSLRIYIRNLAPKEKEALIEVDSLYIGPKSSLPKTLYTVTFLNGDGSILSTQEVAKGDPASYAGKTPTKAPDQDKHYSFSAWDKSLKNITANTTFTPQFTAAQHSFTYSKADRNTHKISCPCGYIGSESHSNTETVTPPTCTAQGYTTYTCSRCHESYKDSYVNAKGHTEAIDKAVAATCTTTGKTEGKHCSVCN